MDKAINMIAGDLLGKKILLTTSDFKSLSRNLLSELDEPAIYVFTSSIIWGVGEPERLMKWKQVFLDRLSEEIRESRFDPSYDFRDEEAAKYIKDYLEVYRSAFSYINYHVGDMHDSAGEFISITISIKQNMLDMMMVNSMKASREINFAKSDVNRIQGVAYDFTVNIDSSVYRFSPKGISQLK